MKVTLTGTLLLGLACTAGAAGLASQLRAEGDELEYNLHLDQALDHFNRAVAADPMDPASYRAVAATYMMRIAFRRGAVTADDFMGGEVNAKTLDMPKPPPDMADAFRRNAEHALQLAEQRVSAHPDTADAHYQLGAAIALLASYSATVDGQVLTAFSYARRAYKEHQKALEMDPGRKDAGLVVGAYQYILSTRSIAVRFFAHMGGLGTNKTRGLELIEAAARYPGENQTDARLALALIYNRERRYDDALAVLKELSGRYPENRLLWLEAGATALRAKRYQQARQFLDEGLAKRSRATGTLAFGEDALWYYKRGAALVGLGQFAAATADLRTSLSKEGRAWVHGRAHTELGKIADAEGDRRAARQEYTQAVALGKMARDASGQTEAEELLESPYHREAPGAAVSQP
jgi:tetratricopeptide (TPR) repeat protein